ncbi:MAG: DUF4097 family beta strand repeat-containing protein [Firmicutes bacterium]|nr:DUF4097 family beta strand repeat-containing protein [Bacillota bacterium]
MKRKTILLIFAALCIAVGVALSGLALHMAGFGWNGAGNPFTDPGNQGALARFFGNELKERKTYDFAPEEINWLIFTDTDEKVTVLPSADVLAHVSYYEGAGEYYGISNAGGRLEIVKHSDRRWYQNFGFHWNTQDTSVTIEIPAEKAFAGGAEITTSNGEIGYTGVSISGPLLLKTSNARITAGGFEAASGLDAMSSNGEIALRRIGGGAWRLTARTSNAGIALEGLGGWDGITAQTTNGSVGASSVAAGSVDLATSSARVTLDGVTARSLSLTTSNGEVNANAVAAENVDLTTSNARIALGGVAVTQSLSLTTSNGSITGTINGKKEDFGITSVTSNARNNLTDNPGGKIQLDVRTSNGDIDLNFR